MENYKPTQPERRLRPVWLGFSLVLALLTLTALLWGLQGVTPAHADPNMLYVEGKSGSDAPACGTDTAPCQTIAFALNNRANDGDTILIAAGTYTENLFVNAITITLRGGYTISGTQWLTNTGETVINGNNAGRVITILYGDITLDRLTLTGGSAFNGGGVNIDEGRLVIVNSVISGNITDGDGGGLVAYGSTVVMQDVVIANNQVTTPEGNAGGLYFRESTQATLTRLKIHDNVAGAGGGGIFLDDTGTSVVVQDSWIYTNTALGGYSLGGGGLGGQQGSLSIYNSSVRGNISHGDGGGIAAYKGAVVFLQDVDVANNRVADTSTYGQGGGLYFRSGSQATLTRVQVYGNTAIEGGGGLHLDDPGTSVIIKDSWIYTNTALGESGAGGGGLGIHQGSLSLSNSTVQGNSAPNNFGGGFEVWEGGYLDVVDSTIAGNTTKDHGGGLYVTQSAANLTNVLITGNSAISGVGNFLAVDDSEVTILNGTIAGNNPQGAQAALLWSGHLTITNSILWNNALALQADPTCPSCFTVSYSDIEGGWTGTGNINLDPLFVAGDDYNLQPASPCIDTGTNTGAPDHDLDQTPRPLDGDGDYVAITDMGAYEFELYHLYMPLVLKDFEP